MSVFNVSDLLLWKRCRRQWVRQCLPEPGTRRRAIPQEMTGIANLRETARVTAIGTAVYGDNCDDLTPPEALSAGTPAVAWVMGTTNREEGLRDWHDRTIERFSGHRCFRNGLVIGDDLAVGIDLGRYHARVGGWELILFRPGTGLREVFEDEATALLSVCRRARIPVSAIHVYYLDKTARMPDEAGSEYWRNLFKESNVTGRAGRTRERLEEEFRSLTALAAGHAVIEPEYRCKQGCRTCNPPATGDGLDPFDVLTLHKGRHLGRELQARGIVDLRQVDRKEYKLTERQLIQIDAVRRGERYVDHPRLRTFMDSLVRPLFFLDFEAYSQSVPPMRDLAPYEHAPVIASLHRQGEPGGEATGVTFTARPGVDERASLLEWLLKHLEDRGSIVVFSKPFESAMIRQLAAACGEAARGTALISRMTDLLQPFAEFMVYDPEQRGKVSLKRVLPIYTESGYDHVEVRDGMHANLSYTRQADAVVGAMRGPAALGARAAEGVSRFLEDKLPAAVAASASLEAVTRYCAVDTFAMVELVDTLYKLVETKKPDTPRMSG